MLLSDFLNITNSGDRFIRFSNADGKRWIVPLRNMRTAMQLYQPSGIKGKLVKQLLPFIYWFPMIKRVLRAEMITVELQSHISEQLTKIFGLDEFQFSIFEGTPSAHQKITIQISRGAKIYGYCKITENEEIIKLFKHEQTILDNLDKQGVGNIPRCLYCGDIRDGVYLFVQSTVKSHSSTVVHEWTKRHWDFLSELHKKTGVESRFEDSDFAKSLDRLSSSLDIFSSANSEVISGAIERISSHYKSQTVFFSVCHADFTPWNMFFERGELFVFDFEYSEQSYPPYLDWFHFFTQTAIFERHMSSDAIYESYLSQESSLQLEIKDVRILYISYLLDIIERYIYREKGELSTNTEELLSLWISLLSKL